MHTETIRHIMKKTLLLSIVALLFTALSVKAQSPTINVVCGVPETEAPYATDPQYILNSLDGHYLFSFYFELPYPATELVDGQTYTLSDMLRSLTYGVDKTNGNTTIVFSSVNFVKYRDGSVIADVTSTTGQNYHITYTWVPIANPIDTVTIMMPNNNYRNRAYNYIDEKGYIYLIGWTDAEDYNLNITFYTTTFANSYSYADRHTDYNHFSLSRYSAPGTYHPISCNTLLEATVTGTDSACTAHIKWVDNDSIMYDITFVYSDPTPDTYHTFTANSVTASHYSYYSNRASDFKAFDGTNTVYATVVRTANNLTGTWNLEKSEGDINKVNIYPGWWVVGDPTVKPSESFNGTITVSQTADGSYTLTGSALMYDHSLWTFYCSSLSPITQPTDTVTVAMSNANHKNRAYDLVDDKGVMKLVGHSDDDSYEMALAFNTTSFAGSYTLADKCDPDFHLSHIAPDGKKSLLYCNNILEATVTGTASSCTAHIKWVDADSTMYDITFAYDDPTPVYHQTFTATDFSLTEDPFSDLYAQMFGEYRYAFYASNGTMALSGTLHPTTKTPFGTWDLTNDNIVFNLLDTTTGEQVGEPFNGTITIALTDDSVRTLTGTALFFDNTEWAFNCSSPTPIKVPNDTVAISMSNANFLNRACDLVNDSGLIRLYGVSDDDGYEMNVTFHSSAFVGSYSLDDRHEDDRVFYIAAVDSQGNRTFILCNNLLEATVSGTASACTAHIKWVADDSTMYDISFAYTDPIPVNHQTFTATDLSITINYDSSGIYAYDFYASDNSYILSGTLFNSQIHSSATLLNSDTDNVIGTWNLADGNMTFNLLDATTGKVVAEPFNGTITIALTHDSLYNLNGTVLFYGNTEWTFNCSFIVLPKDTIVIAMDNAELNHVEKVVGEHTAFHIFGADLNDEYRMELTSFADQIAEFDKDNVLLLLQHNTAADTTIIEVLEISGLKAQGDTTECAVEIELLSADTVLYMIAFSYQKQEVVLDNVNETICVVTSEDNSIVILAAEGQALNVSDIAGRTIFSGKTSFGIGRVRVPMPGIYTVRIGKRTVNVLVK